MSFNKKIYNFKKREAKIAALAYIFLYKESMARHITMSEADIAKINEMIEDGKAVRDIAKEFNVTPPVMNSRITTLLKNKLINKMPDKIRAERVFKKEVVDKNSREQEEQEKYKQYINSLNLSSIIKLRKAIDDGKTMVQIADIFNMERGKLYAKVKYLFEKGRIDKMPNLTKNRRSEEQMSEFRSNQNQIFSDFIKTLQETSPDYVIYKDFPFLKKIGKEQLNANYLNKYMQAAAIVGNGNRIFYNSIITYIFELTNVKIQNEGIDWSLIKSNDLLFNILYKLLEDDKTSIINSLRRILSVINPNNKIDNIKIQKGIKFYIKRKDAYNNVINLSPGNIFINDEVGTDLDNKPVDMPASKLKLSNQEFYSIEKNLKRFRDPISESEQEKICLSRDYYLLKLLSAHDSINLSSQKYILDFKFADNISKRPLYNLAQNTAIGKDIQLALFLKTFKEHKDRTRTRECLAKNKNLDKTVLNLLIQYGNNILLNNLLENPSVDRSLKETIINFQEEKGGLRKSLKEDLMANVNFNKKIYGFNERAASIMKLALPWNFFHIIKSGDTIHSIIIEKYFGNDAAKASASGAIDRISDAILKFNNITSASKIQIGYKLLLPDISNLIKGSNIAMQSSAALIKSIMSIEGYNETPYEDPPGSGVYSIGYGHRMVAGAKKYTKVDTAIASSLLKEDMSIAQDYIRYNIKKPLDQKQFDSLVSIVYNVGRTTFASSELKKSLDANRPDQEIAQKIKVAFTSNSPGLIQRRAFEAGLYLGGEYV